MSIPTFDLAEMNGNTETTYESVLIKLNNARRKLLLNKSEQEKHKILTEMMLLCDQLEVIGYFAGLIEE